MDRILDDIPVLDPALLPRDEDQYDKRAQALIAALNKLPQQEIVAVKDALDSIPPSSHTIYYVYILLAIIDASAASGKAAPRQLPPTVLPEGALWPYVVQLLLDFDPIQARYCGAQLLRVVDVVALGAEQTANYVPALQLIHHVILRLDASSSTLTSTHRTFVRLCLLSQAYSDAAEILDRPIYHIPTSQSTARANKYLCSSSDQPWTYITPVTGLTQHITNRSFLEYHLMGAMCYLALRRYKDAMFFLEVVLSAPTIQNAASAIMVEAYKKWLLVGLVLNGVSPPIPKSVGQLALKNIRAVAKPYDCVADAFKGSDVSHLRAEIEMGNAIWQEEGNYGLMIEVYGAFRKFAILRLGKTFAALSLDEIAQRTSPDPMNVEETKTYLEGLIANGELSAVLTDSETNRGLILRFLPASASVRSELQVEAALASQTQELQMLLKRIQDTEHRMETSREYIEWLKKLKKIRDDEDKNGGSGNGRTGTVDDVDEDMMEEY